jgi:hypothetical protein
LPRRFGMDDLVAAAAANATIIRSVEAAAKTQRAAEAELEDASTVALHACEAPAGMIVPALQPPSSSTRPAPSRSGEVSPVWLYFKKLPATTDADGNEMGQVECIVQRTLANGNKRLCGYQINHKSKDGTKNLLR